MLNGAGTSLPEPKSPFGPTAGHGGRTFVALGANTAVFAYLYQTITLPAGNYKIMYDVACVSGRTLSYNVSVFATSSGGTLYYQGTGTAPSTAFTTVTSYFNGGGGASPSVFLYNFNPYGDALNFVDYANVSVVAGQTPAPTVGNSGACEGSTLSLTAASPYSPRNLVLDRSRGLHLHRPESDAARRDRRDVGHLLMYGECER